MAEPTETVYISSEEELEASGDEEPTVELTEAEKAEAREREGAEDETYTDQAIEIAAKPNTDEFDRISKQLATQPQKSARKRERDWGAKPTIPIRSSTGERQCYENCVALKAKQEGILETQKAFERRMRAWMGDKDKLPKLLKQVMLEIPELKKMQGTGERLLKEFEHDVLERSPDLLERILGLPDPD